MKTFNPILRLLAATALLAVGCVNETPSYKKGGKDDPDTAVGYLSMQGMQMQVIYDDATETMPDDTEKETQQLATRATKAEASDDFIVRILDDASGEKVLEKSYGALKAEMQKGPMELPVGAYRLEVRSEENIPDFAWDHPTYGTSQEFTILKGEQTDIEEVVCTLTNIKVTLMCSADLAEQLDLDATEAVISTGAVEGRFAVNDPRAGYYRAQNALNTFGFRLTGKFRDGNEVKFSKTIANVKAGQWRKITLIIAHSDEGGVKFDIEVENFIQDSEIVVDDTQSAWEFIYEEDPEQDPSAPQLSWPGHDLNQTVELQQAMVDREGYFVFDLTAPNALQSMVVTIESDNAAFVQSMEGMQLPATMDLCALAAGDAAYRWLHEMFELPVGDRLAGATEQHFDLGKPMKLLYDYDGLHSFRIVMTDAKGLVSEATLSVKVDRNGQTAPTIVWGDRDLTDLSKTYTLEPGMSITVDITAPGRIASLLVTIDAEALMPLLSSLPELQQQFDLCTIDGDAAAFLRETVGFKTGDEVKNQPSTQFTVHEIFCDILRSSIEPLEPGVPNTYTFRLEVIDANGVSVEGALRLVQPEA